MLMLIFDFLGNKYNMGELKESQGVVREGAGHERGPAWHGHRLGDMDLGRMHRGHYQMQGTPSVL